MGGLLQSISSHDASYGGHEYDPKPFMHNPISKSIPK